MQEELTKQQNQAADLLERAVKDYKENYFIFAQCNIRFDFKELTELLHHPIMSDRERADTHFEMYLRELYRISIVVLSVTRSKTFYEDFTSLKLVTHLPHIKS